MADADSTIEIQAAASSAPEASGQAIGTSSSQAVGIDTSKLIIGVAVVDFVGTMLHSDSSKCDLTIRLLVQRRII